MKAGWMTMPLAFVATLAFLFAVGTSGAGVDVDTDGDGVQQNIDNCPGESNSDQTDTDRDGHGNACDGDFDQNGLVGLSDFGALSATFGLDVGDPAYNENVNCDGTTIIGLADFGCFSKQFNNGLGGGGVGGPGPGHPCAAPAGTVPQGCFADLPL